MGGLRRDIFRASQSSDEYSAFVQSGTTDQVKMGLG